MEQKIILITGTNSGFGWLTAKSCAALGHKIYGTMRATKGRNADKVKELIKQPNIEVLDMELTNEKSVTDAVKTILEKEGRLDVGESYNCVDRSGHFDSVVAVVCHERIHENETWT